MSVTLYLLKEEARGSERRRRRTLVEWSTKYVRPVAVNRISNPLGNGPKLLLAVGWATDPLPPAPPCPLASFPAEAEGMRGSRQVVVRSRWQTKYGLPWGVTRCSHPSGRGWPTAEDDEVEEEATVVGGGAGAGVVRGETFTAAEEDKGGGRVHDVVLVVWST